MTTAAKMLYRASRYLSSQGRFRDPAINTAREILYNAERIASGRKGNLSPEYIDAYLMSEREWCAANPNPYEPPQSLAQRTMVISAEEPDFA